MIARRSLLIILNKGLGVVIGFVGLFAVLRYLPKDAYGMYAFTLSLLAMFAVLNGLGVHAAHVKRISEGHDERRANGAFVTLKLGLLALFLASVVAVYWVWTGLLGQEFTQATTPRLLAAMVAVYVTLSLRHIFDLSFQAHRRIALSESVQLIDTVVTSTAFFTAAQVWRHVNGRWVPFQGWAEFWADVLRLQPTLSLEDGALMLTGAFFLGTLTSFIVSGGIFVVHRYPIGLPDRATLRAYMVFGVPVALLSVLSILQTNIDTVFVGYFWLRHDVADYRAAVQLVAPLLVVNQAVWTLLFPTVSDLYSRGESELVAPLVAKAERYLSMVVLGGAMVAFVFTEEGLRVVSSEQYLTAAPTLRLLLLSAVASSLLTPSKSILLGSDRPFKMLWVGAWITTTVVVLNLLLVPESILGIPLAGLRAPGAALGTLVAMASAYIYLKTLVRRHAAVQWLPRGISKHLVAAGVAGGLLWLAKVQLGPTYFDRFWELAIAGVVGLALYGAVLLALREFRREDWEFAKEVAHPGKMGDYIREELRGNNVRED